MYVFVVQVSIATQELSITPLHFTCTLTLTVSQLSGYVMDILYIIFVL